VLPMNRQDCPHGGTELTVVVFSRNSILCEFITYRLTELDICLVLVVPKAYRSCRCCVSPKDLAKAARFWN
jgi:hypothetical protein